MIQVRNLTKTFQEHETVTPVLRGLTFSIRQGEFVAIMGPSGSGKSTLLHLLSFLDRPSAGEYVFNGKDTMSLSDDEFAQLRNSNIGFIFQSFNLLSRSSVYENCELPLLYNSRVPFSKRRGLVEQSLAAVDLTEKMASEAGKLSGGQKQRVAIARALINQPDVIFADEPTGNLDSESGRHIMEILEKLNKEGRTIILVTHETTAASFARRTIQIKDGKIDSDTINAAKPREDFFK